MSTPTSAASSGSATVPVTLSSLSAQLTATHQLLVALVAIFAILLVSGIAALCWSYAKSRRHTAHDVERAIPLTAVRNTRGVETNTAAPASPAASVVDFDEYPALNRWALHAIPAGPATPEPTYTRTSAPRPRRAVVPQAGQSHGADYTQQRRGRRYDDEHLATSGPAPSSFAHNNSAYETSGSRRMDKINNS